MTAFAVDQDDVRAYVLQSIEEDRRDLARRIQKKFGVSRATAHNYLRALIRERLIERTGVGQYEIVHRKHEFIHTVQGLEEHQVWQREIAPILADLPDNVNEMWHYGCTEMLNNVIDHSESETTTILLDRSAKSTEIAIHDRGVGIFRKIARSLNLEDDRHAVLELSKGKVTTDPENHTGEGIFFSSRAFDGFEILSDGVFFRHQNDHNEDWILGDERRRDDSNGTSVFMTLNNDSERKLVDVFDEYATDSEDYRFDKTVVPVKLLQYGDDRLVSRSQAKRLMARFDRFRLVVLDFEDVESVGQSFADEVFRVFPSQHPQVEVISINANEQVARMTHRAISGRQPLLADPPHT